MKIKLENISIIAVILLVLKTMLSNSMYFKLETTIELFIELIAYGLIFFSMIKKIKFQKKKLICIFLITCIIIYTGIKVGNMIILASFFALLVASYVDKEKLVNVILKTIVCVFTIHVIIYFIKLIYMKDISGIIIYKNRYRHMLGFAHPNVASAYVLWAFMAYVFKNKSNYNKIFFSQIVVLIIYYLTNTRTLLLCLIFFDILFIVSKYNKKIIKNISENIFLIMSITVVVILNLYINYNNEFLNKIDQLSSRRLFFASKAIENYGYTLLGQSNPSVKLNIEGHDVNIITDVLYYALLYNYGIIYFIILNILVRYTSRKNETIVQIFIIIWSIFAFFELYSINLLICFPLLFGADWIGVENE